MLPTVDFCGLELTRMVIGANPFGGYSHQNPRRDAEMRDWNTPDRIRETWARAEAAGINGFVTNNETPHVIDTTAAYLADGGQLTWIAQVNNNREPDFIAALNRVKEIGASAAFLHGGVMDSYYQRRDEDGLRRAIEHGKSLGLPMGTAGHTPAVHYWIDSLNVVDFHVVCFFNCGSVHAGRGDRFYLGDVFEAVKCIQALDKPCIGYKIVGSGRLCPRMAFEYAFSNIKPGDIVNVGMHRGDRDDMVEANVAMLSEVLDELGVAEYATTPA